MENVTIKWEEDGETGWVKTGSCGHICYNKKKGIEKEISQFLLSTVSYVPYWNHAETKDKRRFQTSNLTLVIPVLTDYEITKMGNIIRETCKTMLFDQIKNKNLSDPTLTDYEFLALLGTKRNWIDNCLICLEEKIGKVCGCGLTSKIVFRPCGHTFCMKPCFDTWLESSVKIKNPQQLVVKTDGYKKCYSGFPCLVCRTMVDSTFCPEYIDLSKNIDLVKRLTVEATERIDDSDRREKDNSGSRKKQKVDTTTVI